jgi:hypothetical protein
MSHAFVVRDDVDVRDRWYLDSLHDTHGRPLEAWDFTRGQPVQVAEPLVVSVRRPGRPLDWTFADFDMPVVKPAARELLESLAASHVQFHEARVVGSWDRYAVANIITVRACIDDQRSEFLKWTPADGREDKIGDYRQVTRLKVDPMRMDNAAICRLAGWRISVVVCRELKEAIEAAQLTGLTFEAVD